jgi:hypothetical protein
MHISTICLSSDAQAEYFVNSGIKVCIVKSWKNQTLKAECHKMEANPKKKKLFPFYGLQARDTSTVLNKCAVVKNAG